MSWTTASWIIVAAAIATLPFTRRRAAWARLFVDIVALAALSFTLLHVVGSIVTPRFAGLPGTFPVFADKLLLSAWWLLASRTVILAGEWALRINHQNHAARFATDLVAGTVYIGAALAIIDTDFGVSLTGLLATSGIIAIVLGLALQNTLGDLFSGIAVRLDRPFGVGDLIRIDDSTEGRVIETNWRSTRIATGEGDVATVPNSVIAKSKVLNRSYPTEAQNDKVTVLLDPQVPVERSMAVLNHAMAGVSLPGPQWRIACTDLRGDAVAFDIHFSAPISTLDATRSKLLQDIARHARYAGIALATHGGTPPKPAAAPNTADLLADIHVFAALPAEELHTLAGALVRRSGEAGTALIEQGGSTASLFILAEGTLEVLWHEGSHPRRLGLFGPGEYFGELSLLCGLPNAVTVNSLTPFVAYELTKATIEPLLHANPAMAQALEVGAERAQALLHRAVAVKTTRESATGAGLLGRIRTYFALREDAA